MILRVGGSRHNRRRHIRHAFSVASVESVQFVFRERYGRPERVVGPQAITIVKRIQRIERNPNGEGR